MTIGTVEVFADLAADLVAIHARQHHVEEHEVERVGPEARRGPRRRRGGGDVEPGRARPIAVTSRIEGRPRRAGSAHPRRSGVLRSLGRPARARRQDTAAPGRRGGFVTTL
jgi:hypothetical protein